jgi:hypothetical protein
MRPDIEIRSARDGMVLTLSNLVQADQSALSESFLVSLKGYKLQAEIRASSFMAPNLGAFFRELSENWRGWEGKKSWATLEGELELSATSDSQGHIRLAYVVKRPHTDYQWELTGALELEAGQLAAIAAQAELAWRV